MTETVQFGTAGGLSGPPPTIRIGKRWSDLETAFEHLSCMEDQHSISESGGLEPLLSTEELAEYLGVPVATLLDWRVDHKGPVAIIIGRRVKYAIGDVRDWLAQRRESEPGDGSVGW